MGNKVLAKRDLNTFDKSTASKSKLKFKQAFWDGKKLLSEEYFRGVQQQKILQRSDNRLAQSYNGFDLPIDIRAYLKIDHKTSKALS